jgi:hypothetical protein
VDHAFPTNVVRTAMPVNERQAVEWSWIDRECDSMSLSTGTTRFVNNDLVQKQTNNNIGYGCLHLHLLLYATSAHV